jgi:hypothetical protein
MKKLYSIASFFVLIFSSFCANGQNNFFLDQAENSLQRTANEKRVIIPGKYRTTRMDMTGMKNFLWSLPAEQNPGNRNQAPIIELPMPNGTMAKFRVWESTIMEPGLATKYPEIKTFAGQGISDPYATIRFDYNPYDGFHAQVLSVNGNVYIDPYARNNVNNYISYYTRDNKREEDFVCNTISNPDPNIAARIESGPCRGTQLYTYRLALACTGEYAVAVCSPAAPTVPLTLTKMITSVNRVTGVYETELSIRMILVANTDQLIYLDGTADPYTNNNGGTMLGQNQTNIDNIIGSGNYDIGHVFSTGGGGIAGLGVVCRPGQKSRGVTGLTNPVGDNFDIDYVAHEMGHEYGGNHPFNSQTGSCGGGNRNGSTAYEVGSGTSIMAYAGICGSDDIQPHSDPFMHTISFDEISNYVAGAGGTCPSITATGNTLPVITSMSNNNVNIPLNTPFTLTGSATDADGDALTYCWEEWDLGPAGAWNSGAVSTTAPLFKSRPPSASGSRTFPDISVILAGYPANPPSVMEGLKGETLPQIARNMKFRLTVRDNRAGGGGVVTGGEGCQAGFTGTFQVTTVDGTGPFLVTVPNGGENWPGGSSQTITWNTAGTNAAPINAANVKISLSTDGGQTYPTVLAASTPNDGSETLNLPAVTSTTARIKVEAVGNIFFDISNNNFTLSTPVTNFDFGLPAAANVACNATTTSTITLGTTSSGGYNTPINLSASNVPSGATVTFGTNPVIPGSGSDVTLNNVNLLSFGTYNVTINGISGTITHTRVVTFNVQPGTAPTITVQPTSQSVCSGGNVSFGVTAPAALSYQWEVSTNGGVTYVAIGGATSSTYILNGVGFAQNNYQYHCFVTGQCNTLFSNPAVLTVFTAPSITTQPQSVTLCAASNNIFSVAANGTNLSYQWQLSTNGGGTFNDIGGAIASTYTAAGITAGMNGYQYRTVVNGTCTPSATSNAAILTVISPVIVTTQSADITICETGNVSFTVAGSGAGVLYQWQLSTDGGINYSNIGGATLAMLNVNAVTAAMNNNRYRALLSNPTCTTPTPSNGAILTVNARPTVALSASPYTNLFPGLITTLTAAIVPSATGFNITWNRNGTVIPGVAGTTYTTGVTGLGDYRVDIVNTTTGCNNQSNVLRIADSASSRLFIYPSPNDGHFTVAYYNSGGASIQRSITVYDDHGARMYSAGFVVTGPYQLLDINIKPAARGVYILVIGDVSGKKLADGKLIVYY